MVDIYVYVRAPLIHVLRTGLLQRATLKGLEFGLILYDTDLVDLLPRPKTYDQQDKILLIYLLNSN